MTIARITLSVVVVSLLIYLTTTPFVSFFTSAFSIGNTITANPTLEDGLVGHWTFDGSNVDWGDTSAEIKDVSGNNNHGDATAGVVPVIGTIGQALEWTVDNLNLDLGTPSALTDIEDQGGGGVTGSAWVYQDPGASSDSVLGAGVDCHLPQANRWSFRVNTQAGTISFCKSYATTNLQVKSNSVSSLTSQKWTHIAYTWDGGSSSSGVKLYVNGNEVSGYSTQTDGVGAKNSDSVQSKNIGRGTNSGQADYVGKMDDVRLYNRVLSADEIQRLYKPEEGTKISETVTSNDSLENGLVGHWTFDGPDMDWGDTAAEVLDLSSYGYNANAQSGMSSAESSAVGVIGQAINFSDTSYDVTVSSNWRTHFEKDFSVSFWMYHTGSPSATHDVFSTYDSSGSVSVFARINYWNSRLQFQVGFNYLETTSVLRNNSWQHYTLVRDDSGDTAIYVDGQLNVSTSSSYVGDLLLTGNDVLRFAYGGNTHYLGSLDDFRIYDRVISADEVLRLYELREGTKIVNTIKVPSSPLESGLVGHWTFDGPDVNWGDTSAEIKDVSGNGNDGDTVKDGSPGGDISPIIGIVGQALDWPVQNLGIDLGSPTSLDDIEEQGGGGVSGSAWVYPETGNLAGYVIGAEHDCQLASSDTWTFRSANGAGGLDFCRDYPTTNLRVTASLSSSPALNEWTHVAYSWDGGDLASGVKLYFNGAEVSSYITQTDGVGTKGSDAVHNKRIGSGLYTGQDDFVGKIDDVRIYNRVLSSQEMQQLYQMGQ